MKAKFKIIIGIVLAIIAFGAAQYLVTKGFEQKTYGFSGGSPNFWLYQYNYATLIQVGPNEGKISAGAFQPEAYQLICKDTGKEETAKLEDRELGEEQKHWVINDYPVGSCNEFMVKNSQKTEVQLAKDTQIIAVIRYKPEIQAWLTTVVYAAAGALWLAIMVLPGMVKTKWQSRQKTKPVS